MSYKIEVTAPTLSELAGKLLALASTMQAIPAEPASPEANAPAKPRRATKAEKPVEEPQPAPVIEDAVLEPEPAPEPEPAVEEPQPVVLDFEKDVTPVVLAGVKQRGKPWIQDILAQFGVERASQVPDERLAELVSIIKDGLE